MSNKKTISASHLRFILNAVIRGHSTETEHIIAALRKAGLVDDEEFSLSAAANQGATISASDFGDALRGAGLPIEARLRVKAAAAAEGLIS